MTLNLNPKFKPGQDVVLFNKCSGGYAGEPKYRVGMVERITRFQVTVNGHNYLIRTGKAVGEDNACSWAIVYDPTEPTGLMSVDKVAAKNAEEGAK